MADEATPVRSAAQQAAFERCRAARAAALERKKAKASAPPPPPEPSEPEVDAPPPAELEVASEVDRDAPTPPAEVPPPAVDPRPVGEYLARSAKELAGAQRHVAQEEGGYDGDVEFVDADDILDLLKAQTETLSGLRADLDTMRMHQADLSQSFVRHGVQQEYSINFV